PPPHLCPLSLHDALPISDVRGTLAQDPRWRGGLRGPDAQLPPARGRDRPRQAARRRVHGLGPPLADRPAPGGPAPLPPRAPVVRSEEHTSELQSPYDLVC